MQCNAVQEQKIAVKKKKKSIKKQINIRIAINVVLYLKIVTHYIANL